MPQEDKNSNDKKESTMLPPIPKSGELDQTNSTTDIERVLGNSGFRQRPLFSLQTKQWSLSEDFFVINSRTFKKVVLKNPTQSVSPIYDPMGFISPFTVRLK